MDPQAVKNSEVRVDLFQMAQAITTQDQAITTQANKELFHRENQHSSTMSSHLGDFTGMNTPTYFWSKVDEDPKDFFDEVYMILFTIRVSTMENAELATY